MSSEANQDPSYRLLKRYINKTAEILRFYAGNQCILEIKPRYEGCNDIANAFLYGICHNSHILFCNYRTIKNNVIIENRKDTNYKHIIGTDPSIDKKIASILETTYPEDIRNLSKVEKEGLTLRLEELLEQAVIGTSGVPCEDVKMELTNLTSYRDKYLAHADDSPSPDTHHPRTEILAKLAHGFHIIVLKGLDGFRIEEANSGRNIFVDKGEISSSFDEKVNLFKKRFNKAR